MALKEDLQKALIELRKGKERKFDQTVDLIVNLQKFDLKKNQVNTFVSVPHKIKDKKIHLEIEEKFKQFAELFKDKFKEILDLDLVVEGTKEEEKKEGEEVKEEKKVNTKEEEGEDKNNL